MRTIISRAFAQAVADGVIPSNPASRPGLPKTVKRKIRVLRPDELETLADAIDERYRAMVYAAAYGALRFGEAVGLRRRDVKFLERKLDISATIVEVAGKVSRVDRAKTNESIRHVPIPAFLVDELAGHMDKSVSPRPTRSCSRPRGRVIVSRAIPCRAPCSARGSGSRHFACCSCLFSGGSTSNGARRSTAAVPSDLAFSWWALEDLNL